MAEIIIPIRDETLKTDIEDAFVASFANPNSLSPENLVIEHVSNYIRDVLNNKRESDAIVPAQDSVTKEDSLT